MSYLPTTSMTLRLGHGRDRHMLVLRLPTSDHCIFQKLCDTWNKLPYAIRALDSYSLFKKRLKTHFFKKAFEL